MEMRLRRCVTIPDYTPGEELFNSVSHGIGALLGAAGLALMLVRARGALELTAAALFGASMILLYTMSCLYHALPAGNPAKKVLRVLDHCNVFLLVFGTYIPAALLGVGGSTGWILFGFVGFFTVLGVILTAVDLERFKLSAVICQLLSGWSILFGVTGLLQTVGSSGILYLILGGIMYSVGAILYGLGKKKRYAHSVFHLFCLLGSFFHFWAVYRYLL